MPKIQKPETASTRVSIMNLIHEIQAMLDSRLDTDNINDRTSIGSHRVEDIADFSRPVVSDKLFATGNGTSFFHDVLDRAFNLYKKKTNFRPLSAELVFELASDATRHITSDNNASVSLSGEERTREYIVSQMSNQVQPRTRDEAISHLGLDVATGLTGLPINPSAVESFTNAVATFGVGGFGLLGLINTIAGIGEEKDFAPPNLSGIIVPKNFNVQRKIITHPVNYKVATFKDIFEVVDGMTVPGEIPVTTRLDTLPIYSISQSISMKNSENKDIRSGIRVDISPMSPEKTMITASVNPAELRTDKDKDNYYLLMASIEVLFKVIP